MDIELITTLCYAGIATLGTIISVVKRVKTNKNNKELEKKVKFSQVTAKIPAYINEAEAQIGSGNGYVKKAIVINNLQQESFDKNIEFKRRELDQSIEAILTTPQKKLQKEDINGKKNEIEAQSGQQSIHTDC